MNAWDEPINSLLVVEQ